MTVRVRVRRISLYALTAALLAAALALFGGCDQGDDEGKAGEDRLSGQLAEAFRSEPSNVRITYDFWPGQSRVSGRATIRFRMRPGQSRALFHFNPSRGGPDPDRGSLTSVEVDGQPLDPDSVKDLRQVRAVPGAEPALEIQPQLSPDEEHIAKFTWSMPKPRPPLDQELFFANFDDTEGPKDQTETVWPTVSSPEAQIRHQIRLRVHSKQSYTVIGSQSVRRNMESPEGLQVWDLDTGRAVASHTVFFAAVPSDRFSTYRLKTSGVDVTIVSDLGPKGVALGESISRRSIARLIEDFGPFPMPRMQILLTAWDSGMEYYGATRTGLGSLAHELAHMYFGVTAVNRTWRDTWFDEAAVSWWEGHRHMKPVGRGFRSSIAVGRPMAAAGFNERAYDAGARVLEAIARSMGGDQKMMSFLKDVYTRREFQPFTTGDFIDDVLDGDASLDRRQLDRWLLCSGCAR